MPGTSQEYGGIIKHGAKLLYAYAEATVPKITVITRKAYGGAYDVMASKAPAGDVNFAWPNAEDRGDGAKGAVKSSSARTRATRRARGQEAEYKALRQPFVAAARSYIDDVIQPGRDYQRVCRSLAMLKDKLDNPWRKHETFVVVAMVKASCAAEATASADIPQHQAPPSLVPMVDLGLTTPPRQAMDPFDRRTWFRLRVPPGHRVSTSWISSRHIHGCLRMTSHERGPARPWWYGFTRSANGFWVVRQIESRAGMFQRKSSSPTRVKSPAASLPPPADGHRDRGRLLRRRQGRTHVELADEGPMLLGPAPSRESLPGGRQDHHRRLQADQRARPSTPATASCPRTRTSRGAARKRASSSSAPSTTPSRPWATRSPQEAGQRGQGQHHPWLERRHRQPEQAVDRHRHWLPRDDQGQCRRRWQRPACGLQRQNETLEGFSSPPQRGAQQLWRPRLHREVRREPRHIEIQVLGAPRQRRLPARARVLHPAPPPEGDRGAPSPFISDATRKAMGEQAVAWPKTVKYQSAGTVSSLSARRTLLPGNEHAPAVEHPVTECITGLDLVEQMIRVARAKAGLRPGRHPPPRLGHRVPHQRGGPLPATSALHGSPGALPAAWGQSPPGRDPARRDLRERCLWRCARGHGVYEGGEIPMFTTR